MNEAKTLTLEAGKYYRMRDGRKAYVAAINPMKGYKGNYPVIGCVDDGTSSDVWTLDGKYSNLESSSHDLVAEWVEPKRVKGWVAVKGELTSNLKPTPASAADGLYSIYGLKPDAVFEVDVLEGHGLNGEAA